MHPIKLLLALVVSCAAVGAATTLLADGSQAAATNPPSAPASARSATLPERMAQSLRTTLPLVVLDTDRAILKTRKITGRMRLMNHATNRVGAPANGYDGFAGIEIRGHSSARFAKKSYAVELRDAAGENRNEKLLGMPSANDWALYASHSDKSLMRNVLAYSTARRLGGWAARTRYVELVLNGRYQGVYVLMETVKLDRDRVAAAGSGIGGRYLAEMTLDKQVPSKGAYFRTPVKRQAVVYHDPERKELSQQEAAYLRRVVGGAERALYRRGAGSWRRQLHAPSAVDYVLLQELFKNADAFEASTFMFKGAGATLKLGPIWDLDIAMGNSRRGTAASTAGWITRNRVWGSRLLADPRFQRSLKLRWRKLRATGLRASVLQSASASVRELGPAANRNFRRWPVLSQRVWQEPMLRGSYSAEVRGLRAWLNRRVAWLDRQLGV
ncbi:MAG: CotH kinase family protein [Actinomycetota bacterium]|nr:CotH kinase family protein [Actinomycetota bacterium]